MNKLWIALPLVSALAAGATLAVKYEDWFVTPKIIEAKRGYVVQQMRDPSTVQFKGERLTNFGWLCGELNGKNAYGAYTGFKRFASRAHDDAWIEGAGYAGKPDARSTTQIIEDLEYQNKITRAFLEAKAAAGDPKPSPAEMVDFFERERFLARWKEHCS